MIAVILAEVSTLGETMRKLCDGFVIVHKVVIRLHGLLQQNKVFVKNIKNIQVAITYVQEWAM